MHYQTETKAHNRTTLTGLSLIGFREGHGSAEPLYATDPTTGEPLEPAFIPATRQEVELAVRLAADAFTLCSRTSGSERGAFLRAIATKIESISDELVERAGRETALPPARLGRNRAHVRPAPSVCPGRGGGIMGRGAD